MFNDWLRLLLSLIRLGDNTQLLLKIQGKLPLTFQGKLLLKIQGNLPLLGGEIQREEVKRLPYSEWNVNTMC